MTEFRKIGVIGHPQTFALVDSINPERTEPHIITRKVLTESEIEFINSRLGKYNIVEAIGLSDTELNEFIISLSLKGSIVVIQEYDDVIPKHIDSHLPFGGEYLKYDAPYILKTLPRMDDCIYAPTTKKQHAAVVVPIRSEPKIGRNESCPCGSGKKYKKCCL